jgi:hypothetical protein
MRKTLVLIIMAGTCLWGCSKKKNQVEDPDSFDKTNRIFRVISNSNVKYWVNIVELSSNADTLQNVTSNSPSDFNFGFTPKVGSQIIIKATAPSASSLNCTVAYKGIRLGLDSVKIADKSLEAKFLYTVKD